jgi:uncharacterized protein
VTYPYESLPENLAAFCAVLRSEYRFRIGPRELQDAARALEMAHLLDERTVRDVLRPVLAGRLEEVQVFDRAFDRFFHARRAPLETAGVPGAIDATPRVPSRESPAEIPSAGRDAAEGGSGAATEDHAIVDEVADAGLETAAGLLRASYSPLDAEGTVPDLAPADRAWREAAALLVNRVRAGLSRRWRPAARGPRFDLRRTLRSSLHMGAEIVIPRWRARPRRRPRFVLLIDGSRSMGVQAQPALRMAVALAAITRNLEVLTFSTALERITRDVRRAAGGQRRHLHLQYAWGGGTTIGVCLREFLHRFGERVLGRDTVVIIASDGLDVGDPGVLRDAMARLTRLSAAIVWLNPLLDTPGYEPTARGMSLARPFVTTFASVRDAAGLAQLSRAIRVK